MSAKHLWKLIAIGVFLAIPVYAWPVWSNPELHVRGTPTSEAGGIDLRLMHRVESALMDAGIDARGVVLDRDGVTVRLASANDRDHALAVLKATLGANHTVTSITATLVP